jgi:hypothetical protein
MSVDIAGRRAHARAPELKLTPAGIPLLPENPPRFAPVTRKLMLRSAAILATVVVASLVLVFVVDTPAATAIGLSLIFPGAGFLYAGSPILFVVTVLLFWGALILWWGMSAVFLPWIVMAAAAAGAAALAGGDTWGWAIPATYVLFAGVLGFALYTNEHRYRTKRAAIPELNRYLASAEQPTPVQRQLEPTEADSEMLKWLLDLSLQPVDDFAGFDYGEQFHGPTCLRYQLCIMGSAMALANANLLPNYPSLITQAQENLVEKQTDIRNWRYWRIENILGNLDFNPDPIVRDNIMLSGWLLNQIGEMEAASGSTKFDEPGSLQFVWRDGRVFSYDHHSLAEVVAKNFLSADLGIFPCEPGWVFTVCNAIAAEGMKGYETAHESDLYRQITPALRAGIFEEMMTPDGAIRHVRSTQFGFTYRDGDNIGEYFTSGLHGFVDFAPDMARRGSLLQLRGVPEKMAALKGLIKDGELDLKLPATRERSTGYMTSMNEWFKVIAGAHAVGEEELSDAAWRRMLRDCATGRSFPERPLTGGAQNTALMMMVRWGTPLSGGDLVARGFVPPVGPILEYAPYPDVLVSKARCEDGESLDLTIEPHRAGSGDVHELTFLVAERGKAHRLTGDGVDETLQPDASGRVVVSLPIAARMNLNLFPSQS